MADAKISALTNLTAADPTNDMIPIVDVSDTPPASGNTKRISINNILSSSPTASGALTVTGLVTAGSASITGAATVGTTLGVTGVSTLTGNAFANGSYTVAGGTPGAFANAALTINNRSNTGDLSLIALGYRPNGTVLNGSAYMGYIITNNSGNGLGDLIFGTRNVTTDTAPTERLRINANGNILVSTGNVVMSTSGAGIDFSAVTGGTGTATANVLNDYEEGTFTPTIAGSTIAGVGVYSGQSGKYTKVGNLVTVQIYLNWSALTGGTGNMRVGNLPFTNTSNFWPASVGYLNNIALTAGSVMTAFVDASAAYIALWQYPTGGGAATEVPVDAAGAIVLSASYTVA